jgi:hypothetical protein
MDAIQEEEEARDESNVYGQENDGNAAADDSSSNGHSLAEVSEELSQASSSTATGAVPLGDMPLQERNAADDMIRRTAADEAALALFDNEFIRRPDDSASTTASDLDQNGNDPQIQSKPATAGHAVIASPSAVTTAQGNSRSGSGSSTAFSDAHASNDDFDGFVLGSQDTEAQIDANLRLYGITDHSIGAVTSPPTSHRCSEGGAAPRISADGFLAADTGAVASHISGTMHAADVQRESEPGDPRDDPLQDGTAPGHLATSIGPPAPHVDAQPTPTPQPPQQNETHPAAGGQHAELSAAVLPAPGEIGDSKAIAVAQATLWQQLLSTAAWLEGELAQLTKAAQVRIICEAPLMTVRQRVG